MKKITSKTVIFIICTIIITTSLTTASYSQEYDQNKDFKSKITKTEESPQGSPLNAPITNNSGKLEYERFIQEIEDKKEFTALIKKARYGTSSAQYSLGRKYLMGSGVPKNYIEAYAWFHTAYAQKHPAADEAVFSIFEKLSESDRIRANDLAEEYQSRYIKKTERGGISHSQSQEIQKDIRKILVSKGFCKDIVEEIHPANECDYMALVRPISSGDVVGIKFTLNGITDKEILQDIYGVLLESFLTIPEIEKIRGTIYKNPIKIEISGPTYSFEYGPVLYKFNIER